MGTPHAPSVSAGSPQGYAFSNTSQQHIEAIFQEMATLSAQPGPFPKQCLWCWILIHGHAHAMHGHADSLSADQQLVLSEQQQLHNQHHHEPKLTTEQTRTPPDDPQQQVHNEQQQQQMRNSTEASKLQHVSQSPTRERERPNGVLGATGRGSSHDVDKHHDSLNTEKVHDSAQLEMEKVELMEKVTDMETMSIRDLRQALKVATDAESLLRALLQESDSKYHSTVKSYNSRVSSLTTRIAEYETTIAEYKSRVAEQNARADKLSKQLFSTELSISKHVGGAGAHKDSHATPPNLVKFRELVNQAALACTNEFIAFLQQQNAYNSHVAVCSVPNKQLNKTSRKNAVHAYICSRLFAGFENDCYMDGLDSFRSSKYLPAEYEETQFFLRNQDLELRYKRYVAEYESVQNLGVEGIMNTLKNLDTLKKLEKNVNAPFLKFCCRKLVSIMNDVDKFAKEFPPSRDYSQRFLLQQLATNSAYCGTFVKPFVNLAMAAFLLHRVAFQFQPPARIFRYASGTPFNAAYMEHAVPIDHGESDKDFVVGLMLIPGFQVGATIIKCTVYCVPMQY